MLTKCFLFFRLPALQKQRLPAKNSPAHEVVRAVLRIHPSPVLLLQGCSGKQGVQRANNDARFVCFYFVGLLNFECIN